MTCQLFKSDGIVWHDFLQSADEKKENPVKAATSEFYKVYMKHRKVQTFSEPHNNLLFQSVKN